MNNNGLGITGGRLLAKALSSNTLRLKVFIAGRNRLENDGAKALAAVFQVLCSWLHNVQPTEQDKLCKHNEFDEQIT